MAPDAPDSDLAGNEARESPKPPFQLPQWVSAVGIAVSTVIAAGSLAYSCTIDNRRTLEDERRTRIEGQMETLDDKLHREIDSILRELDDVGDRMDRLGSRIERLQDSD